MLAPMLALVALFQGEPAHKQPTTAAAKNLQTMPAVATRAKDPPRIDGRDDDAVWRIAPKVDAFRQFEPHVDVDPNFKTEFQVAYDDRNLYVFLRMYDPHPDSIMHALSRRDVRGPSDQIKIIIDSYDDRRTGYELAVNPDGVKRDYAISNDNNEDDSWNGIWDVATTVDSLGWTAEFRVPLSQLRFAAMPSNTFGFGVWRDVERRKERESWPLYSPTRNGLASQLGQLTNLVGIDAARQVEATPYLVTKNVQRTLGPDRFARHQEVSAGGDLKIGITPNVRLDATVNPDFGQVESDPAVVNLTAFETFLQERRPFFVEGTGLYQFQLNCYIVVDCSTNEGLFYSRRIGRAPSLGWLYGDAGTATSTPIAAASKLTGRTRNGLSFGLLDAYTETVKGINHQTAEPGANYAVLRAQQDLRGGEAELSIIGTSVNRSLDQFTLPYLHRAAYTGGASFRNRFYNKEYELSGQFVASRVEGDRRAILLTQTSPTHYYQQPGDRYEVDSMRTALSGDGEQLKFGKYGGGITRFETSILRQSAGLEVNDLGFLRRADKVDWSTWGSLAWRDAKGIYRWLQLNGNHWETWTTSGARLENAVNLNGHMGLNSNWDVHLGGTVSALTPSYCDRCTRGGPLLRSSSFFSPWGGFNSDSRSVVSYGWWTNLWYGDEGHTHGSSLDPYVALRFSSRLQANIGLDVQHNHDNTQWFGNFFDLAGVTHYTFARLEQRTIGMSARINYTLTPDVTFEFYGQPFVSSGTYSNVRELSATPRADSYDARFVPYTVAPGTQLAFKTTQLRSNSVLRWEYRPGSTLFVVWTHGREDDTNRNPNQSWRRDFRDLFALHPENAFLVKVAYWLSR